MKFSIYDSPILSTAYKIILCACIGTTLFFIHLLGLYGICILLILSTIIFLTSETNIHSDFEKISLVDLVGITLSITIGIYFRVYALKTCPSGYGPEPLNFIAFAERLKNEGLSYIPYSWYAHTLYSYVIRAFMIFTDSPVMAQKYASSFISITTLLVLFFSLSNLFSKRIAWLSIFFFASSYWHLFISRYGYNLFLLPFFQALFILTLCLALKRNSLVFHIISGLVVALALHAYWGCYLIPIVWLGVMIYLWLFNKTLWNSSKYKFLIALLVFLLCIIPLIYFFYTNYQFDLSYPISKFYENSKIGDSISTKLHKNIVAIAWSLSGNSNAGSWAHSAPLTNLALSCLFFYGLINLIRNLNDRYENPLIFLMFFIYLLGLCITTTELYIAALLVPIIYLTAYGFLQFLITFQSYKSKQLVQFKLLCFMILLICFAMKDWNTFFFERIHTQFYKSSWFILGENLKESLTNSNVFIPFEEPDRDFGPEITELANNYKYYHFIKSIQSFTPKKIFFTPSDFFNDKNVEIYLPAHSNAHTQIIHDLETLYPFLHKQLLPFPAPYNVGPYRAEYIAQKITLSGTLLKQQLTKLFSEEKNKANNKILGYFYAPKDGEYHFRHSSDNSKTSFHVYLSNNIHHSNTNINKLASNGNTYLLEQGPYQIDITSADKDLSKAEFSTDNKNWEPLTFFFHPKLPKNKDIISPYLSQLGRISSFYYRRIANISKPAQFTDIVFIGPQSILAASHDGNLWEFTYNPENSSLTGDVIGQGAPSYLSKIENQLFGVTNDGKILTYKNRVWEIDADLQCHPIDVTTYKSTIYILCTNNSLKEYNSITKQIRITQLEQTKLLSNHLQLSSFAVNSSNIFGLDWQNSNLIYFDNNQSEITISRQIRLPNLWMTSEIRTDNEGFIYHRRADGSYRVFDKEQKLLFNSFDKSPNLFFEDDIGTPLGLSRERKRLSFSGSYAMSIFFGNIDIYKKINFKNQN
jgi:hypothetical protein